MNLAPHPWFAESTLSLGLEGYEFIANTCRRLRSDVFTTRLLGESVACMTASEGFDPDRFVSGANQAAFIPQGGGGCLSGRRCAGEYLTTATLGVALETLARHLQYEVPSQDADFDLARIPTRPRGGFLIQRVQLTQAAAHPTGATVRCPYSEAVSSEAAELDAPAHEPTASPHANGERVRPGAA